MVYAWSNICPWEWDTQTTMEFWKTNGSPNLARTAIYYNNHHHQKKKKKKRWTCKIEDVAVLASRKIELKEKRRINTSTLPGNWKKLRNLEATFIIIVIGALGRVNEGLIKELEDFKIIERVETIQTTVLLRSARILRSVLKTCHSNSRSVLETVTQTLVKDHKLTLSKVIIIIIMVILISGTQTTIKETTQVRHTNGKKWTKENNKNVLHCYFKSNPKQRAYRKRIIEIWGNSVTFNTTKSCWSS